MHISLNLLTVAAVRPPSNLLLLALANRALASPSRRSHEIRAPLDTRDAGFIETDHFGRWPLTHGSPT